MKANKVEDFRKVLTLESDGMLKFFQFSEDRSIKTIEHFDIALNAVDVEVLEDKLLIKFTCDNSTEVYSLYQISGDTSLDLQEGSRKLNYNVTLLWKLFQKLNY